MIQSCRSIIFYTLAILLAFGQTSAAAMALGGEIRAGVPCHSFALPGSVIFPDGRSRTGRQLQICVVKDVPGDRQWFELSIDGVAYGVYLGRSIARSPSRGTASLAALGPKGTDSYRLLGFSTGGETRRIDTFFGSRFLSVRSLDLSVRDLFVTPSGTAAVLAYAEPDPVDALARSYDKE